LAPWWNPRYPHKLRSFANYWTESRSGQLKRWDCTCRGRGLLRGRSGGWIPGGPSPRKIHSVFRGSRCGCPNRGTFRRAVVVVAVRGWLSRRWWKEERRTGREAQSLSLLPRGAEFGISRILASPSRLCEMPFES